MQQSNWTSIQQLNVDLVYEQNLPVRYSCLFLPFTIAFFITSNHNNSQNRQTANAKKLSKARDRNPPITAHTLTSVCAWSFLRGLVSCTDYQQQNGVHVLNSLFEFELHNSPALDSQRKRRKNEILRSTGGKCSFSKTVIKSTFN